MDGTTASPDAGKKERLLHLWRERARNKNGFYDDHKTQLRRRKAEREASLSPKDRENLQKKREQSKCNMRLLRAARAELPRKVASVTGGTGQPPGKKNRRSGSKPRLRNTEEPPISKAVKDLVTKLGTGHLVAVGYLAKWGKTVTAAYTASMPRGLSGRDLQVLIPTLLMCPHLRLLMLQGCTDHHDALAELQITYLPRSSLVMLNVGETFSAKLADLPQALAHTSIGHIYVSEHAYHGDVCKTARDVCRINRGKIDYKRRIIQGATWTIATRGGAHCFWNLTPGKSTFAGRFAKFVSDVEAHYQTPQQ